MQLDNLTKAELLEVMQDAEVHQEDNLLFGLFVGILDEDFKIIAVETLIILQDDIQRKRSYLENLLDEELFYTGKKAKILNYFYGEANNLVQHLTFGIEDIINN